MSSNSMTRVFFAAFLLVLAPLAFSQTITTADVVGTVTDTTGAVVPNATVTIRYLDTNETRTATTNDAGQYRFPLMRPGEYTISAQSAGLKSGVTRFTLLVGQEQAMNIVLNPQGTQEMIEVTAQASVVQTENANLATSFNQKQVNDLPMGGGDLTTLAMTVPGIRVSVKGGSGNMNANGIPGTSLLFTLNGADVMDPYNNLNNSGASNNLLGANEISEAAVVLNAYSAQYGRMAGGQVNLIGKSGTNGFHGNLVYNYNDAIFNANDFFKNKTNTPRGRADSNQYGGSVGGPIKRNKTFFYFDTEGLRYALPASTTVSIPTPDFQKFVLTHIPASSVPLYQDAFALYNGAPGLNRAVPVTTGNGPLQDSTGNLGCQSKGTFLTTFGSEFGTSKPCAVAYTSNNNQLNTESLLIARVDQNINDKQKVNFRYEYDWGIQATGTSPLNPVFNSVSSQPQHAGQMNYTYVITPNLVNNFIGAGSWYTAIFGVQDFAKAQSLMPERFSFGADGGAQGTNSGNGGFTNVGAGFPTGRNVGQLQLIDDLSWTRGRHTIKAGFNYRYNKVTVTSIAANSFVGTYTFQDLTDFTTGQINSTGKGSAFTQSFPLISAAHIRAYSLNFYVNDDWNVNKKLKLTYGIRFERDGNPICVDNCFARMNEQFGTPAYKGGIDIPYNQTITTGLRTAYKSLEAIIPEPRFGFVFTPFGQNKTVFRGGVGLFANLFAASVANNLDTNSPEVFSPSVTFGQVALVSEPNSSVAAATASDQAFESGFAKGFTFAQIQSALGKLKFSPPGYYSPPQDFVAPKVLQWNFEIEQPLGVHNVLAVTYAGNHGYDQALSNLDANLWISSSNYPNGFAGLPTSAPDPRFLSVTQVLTAGRSNYDGLTVQVRHSFSLGFQGQLGYTWSHALGILGVYNPYNLNAGYGDQNFDTRHMLTGDFVWTSPSKYPYRVLSSLAGGWNIGGKLFLYSGPPFSVTNSSVAARINSSFSSTTANTVIADLLDPSILHISCGHTIDTKCFTASQFATTTTQADFGNIPPDSFRGAGYFDIDANITKSIKMAERATFGIGAQFYNILNHPNFANPSGTVTSGSLGLISSAVGPPTSIYGSFQGAIVSGRVIVVQAKFNF